MAAALPDYQAATRSYGFRNPGNDSLPGKWKWRGTIGEGGSAYAGIWIQYDSSKNPIHRVVIKDCYLGQEWDYPELWYDIAVRIPNEAALAQKLNSCPGSSNILLCYGHETSVPRRMYRVYLEYCPNGDLEDLIEEHVNIRDKGFRDRSGAPFEYRIPIPCLWAIFEALASAACLMHRGRLPNGPPNPQWSALLHMDIKPPNIFLGPPHLSDWRGIPTAKLADFGMITEIQYGEISTGGTEGYVAPEREAEDTRLLDQTLDDPRISTASDIWSIGRVMHSLINLHRDAECWNELQLDENNFPKYSDGVRDYYANAAPELLDAIEGCLESDPRQRTPAPGLWYQIQDAVDTDMKGAPLAARDIIWHKRDDQYALWAR